MTKEKFIEAGFDGSTYEHRALLFEEIKKQAPFDTILDVCCGSGADLFFIATSLPDVSYTGVDNAPGKFISNGNAKLVIDDFRNFIKNQASDSFDIVFGNGALMYFPLEENLIPELLRVAKKAVILSERDQYREKQPSFDQYFKERKIPFSKIRVGSIRPSWETDGYIYTIQKNG